jgi:recombination protein RecR
MMKLPESVKRLIDVLTEFPSIGPRQARRLAFYLVGRGENALEELSQLIRELKHVKPCAACFLIHQNTAPFCDICADPKRNRAIFMIVEKETDLLSLEQTKHYQGRYCIIGPIPKTGILEEWQKLRLKHMQSLIQKECGGVADEIVLAFNPSSVGDFNASLLIPELRTYAKKITRLGRGLPTGGEIEFADEETLGSALEKRSSEGG